MGFGRFIKGLGGKDDDPREERQRTSPLGLAPRASPARGPARPALPARPPAPRVGESRTAPAAAPAPAASPAIPSAVTLAALTLEGTPVCLFEADAELRYVSLFNPPPPLATARGLLDSELLPAGPAERLQALKKRVLESGQAAHEEINLGGREPAVYDVTVSPLRAADGRVRGLTGAMVDVTRRARTEEVLMQAHGFLESQVRILGAELAKAQEASRGERKIRGRAEEELRRLIDRDALTGLPNRRLFLDRLAMAVVHAARRQRRLAVVALGLDDLEGITGSLGRGVTDDLLRSVAAVLEQTLRQGDTIARLEGDEFTVLLPDIASEHDVAQVAEKIRLALRAPFLIGGNEVGVTGSMGVALYPEDGPDPEVLVDAAHEALGRAQGRGGDTFDVHDVGTGTAMAQRLAVEAALRKALVQNTLVLHYQPVREARSGALAHLEALLRWRNPAGQVLPAREFIALAEATGLSVPLGHWALRSACTQARAWQQAGHPGVAVAVNLSSRQLAHPALARLVARVLEETGLPARDLALELSEADLMRDPVLSQERLCELKELGLTVAVDGFGAGTSLLRQLSRFPLDVLKIDRALIQEITADQRREALVAAAVALARALQLTVVAVGVESEDQRQAALRCGCDLMQGTLCGPPVPAAECEPLLAEEPPPSAAS